MPFDFNGNLSRGIRLSNMFSPPEFKPDEQAFDLTQDDYNPVTRFSELYKPETDATNRVNSLLSSMPQREDPRMWRKIAAIGAAFAGPEAVDRTLYSPYHTKMQDWQTELAPALKSAELERSNNVNLRSFANQVVSQEMSDKRFERQLGRDRTLERQGNERLDLQAGRYKTLEDQSNRRMAQADSRIAIAQKLAKGGTFETDDAGNAFIVYRDGTKEPVDAQYLDAETKAQLKQTYSRPQRDRVRTEVIDDPDNPGKKIAVIINMDTNEVTRATIGGKTPDEPRRTVTPVPKTEESTSLKETGIAKGTVNRANMLKNSNPDWSKWIDIKGNNVTIKRPGIFSGPSEEEYTKIYKAVFGNQGPGAQDKTKTVQPPTVRSDGKVPVRRKKDGKTGWVTPPIDSSIYEALK